MTNDARIDQLRGQLREVFDELSGIVSKDAPDRDKEKLTKTFNWVVDQINELATRNDPPS